MKNSGKCPKCQSNDIARIGDFNLNVTTLFRYICTNCGFSEEWCESKDDLKKLKDKKKLMINN